MIGLEVGIVEHLAAQMGDALRHCLMESRAFTPRRPF
jgi:hypothetical protein